MIYELRASRIWTVYNSRLRVNADALLITADVGYVIAVQKSGIVIWRMKNIRTIDAYHKYMTDDFPVDDIKFSDTDYYYNEMADEQVSAGRIVCLNANKVFKELPIVSSELLGF